VMGLRGQPGAADWASPPTQAVLASQALAKRRHWRRGKPCQGTEGGGKGMRCVLQDARPQLAQELPN